MAFDSGQFGYPLQPSIDKWRIDKLLNQFAGEVKRDIDRKLAIQLRQEVFADSGPQLTEDSFKRLARWCKTDGIYGEAGDVARKISEELFGRVIDRGAIGA